MRGLVINRLTKPQNETGRLGKAKLSGRAALLGTALSVTRTTKAIYSEHKREKGGERPAAGRHFQHILENSPDEREKTSQSIDKESSGIVMTLGEKNDNKDGLGNKKGKRGPGVAPKSRSKEKIESTCLKAIIETGKSVGN